MVLEQIACHKNAWVCVWWGWDGDVYLGKGVKDGQIATYTHVHTNYGFFFRGSVELTRTVGTGDWSPPCGSWGSTPRLGTTCPLQRRTVCRSSCLLSSLKHIQSGQHRFLGFGSQAPDVIYFSRSKNKYPISNIIIKLLDIWFYFYKKNL